MNLLLAGVVKLLVTSEKLYGSLFEGVMTLQCEELDKCEGNRDIVLKDDCRGG